MAQNYQSTSRRVVLMFIVFVDALHHCWGSFPQLSQVVQCASNGTGRDLAIGYGCYCGIGNHRPRLPVDRFDTCCQIHDDCYGKLKLNDWCGVHTMYFVRYDWQCVNDSAGRRTVPECKETMSDSLEGMLGVSKECRRQLCACDRDFATCLADSGYPPPGGLSQVACTTRGLAASLSHSAIATIFAAKLSPQEQLKQLPDLLWNVINSYSKKESTSENIRKNGLSDNNGGEPQRHVGSYLGD